MNWRAAMRAALTVNGGADGVPMILALVDERPDPPAYTRADTEANDELARRLDACRAALVATQRDDDLGVVITLLATVAAVEAAEAGSS